MPDMTEASPTEGIDPRRIDYLALGDPATPEALARVVGAVDSVPPAGSSRGSSEADRMPAAEAPQVVATPDIAAAQPQGPGTPIEAERDVFEDGLPAPDAEERSAQVEAHTDREAVMAKLDDMQRTLDDLRSSFEGAAAEDPLKKSLPQETATIEPEVAQAAAQIDPAQHDSEPATVADLAPETPQISSLRIPVTPPSESDSYATAIDKAGAVADAAANTYPTAPRAGVPYERIDTTNQPLAEGAITEVPTFEQPAASEAPADPGNA